MGSMTALTKNLARGIADPLTCLVAPFSLPLERDLQKGWKPTHLFQGSTPNLHHLSCHASSLIAGTCPHPPHQHDDEELLLMLAGEADLLIADAHVPGGVRRHRMIPGKLVYYPAGFAHTIEAAGDGFAQYLMLRWNSSGLKSTRTLPFRELDLNAGSPRPGFDDGLYTHRLLEGPTRCLKRLESHLSFLAPGGGYEPHADAHDVVLILLEGTIATLDARVDAPAAVFYRSGEPHGMSNPGTRPARYLVVEFHGSGMPFRESKPVRLVMAVIRRLIPARLRRRIRRFIARRGEGSS